VIGPAGPIGPLSGPVGPSGPLSGPVVTATVHPSSILRARDEATRQAEMAAFVADLRTVAERLAG